MGHVIVLLSLLLYVYAVLGFHFFRETDPAHWGSLGRALLTLFQILTLEGWVEIQRAVLDVYPLAWIYFSSFVLVAVFVVVNLFIAVVINNLESVKHEQQIHTDSESAEHELLDVIETLRQRLRTLKKVGLGTARKAYPDGHRKRSERAGTLVFSPNQRWPYEAVSIAHRGLCVVVGGPLTLGRHRRLASGAPTDFADERRAVSAHESVDRPLDALP